MSGRAIWDIVLVGIIFFLLVMLAESIREKPPESLTELYFSDHLSLPDMVNGTVQVSFSVRNLEHTRIAYRADITAELYNAKNNYKNISLDSVLIPLDSGNLSVFSKSYDIKDDFTKLKLKVRLSWEDGTLEISFWAKSASQILYYKGLGNGTVDCLSYTNYVQSLEKISITATGTDAQGYPIMQVWLDGNKLAEYSVSGTVRFDVMASAGDGTHYLDIAFINDYYDKASGEDRNLYIEQVFALGRPLRPSFIETGKGIKAFDCLDEAKGLQSEGAARYRIVVGGPR